MNLSTLAIVLGIIGGGGIIGLLSHVVKITIDYTKVKSINEELKKAVVSQTQKLEVMSMEFKQLQTRFEQNEKRDEEERCKNSEKFDELYKSKNKTNETIVELTTTLKMLVSNMDQQFETLNKKIDEIKEDMK